MKKIMMLGAAILALQALPALAQDGGPGPEGKAGHHGGKFMERMDEDKDGAVSEAEFLKSSKEKFVEMDADKDGKITKAELDARRDAMKKKWEARKAEKHEGEKPVEKPVDAPKAE